jgi:hypothetical protein
MYPSHCPSFIFVKDTIKESANPAKQNSTENGQKRMPHIFGSMLITFIIQTNHTEKRASDVPVVIATTHPINNTLNE